MAVTVVVGTAGSSWTELVVPDTTGGVQTVGLGKSLAGWMVGNTGTCTGWACGCVVVVLVVVTVVAVGCTWSWGCDWGWGWIVAAGVAAVVVSGV